MHIFPGDQTGQTLSFEFFPPRNEAAEHSIEKLCELRPDFISVTYGAGGSTRTKSLSLTADIVRRHRLAAISHLVCQGHSQKELEELIEQISSSGVSTVLALRGDPPRDTPTRQSPNSFSEASEFISFIRERSNLTVGAACYPEGHAYAKDWPSDLDHLKRKVSAGASFFVTQAFFEADTYLRFIERVAKAGIELPIVPGILSAASSSQATRFASMVDIALPDALLSRLHKWEGDPGSTMKEGVDWAIDQCEKLLDANAPGIHLYTLNRLAPSLLLWNHLQSYLSASQDCR